MAARTPHGVITLVPAGASAGFLGLTYPVPEGASTFIAFFVLRMTQAYFMGMFFLLSGAFRSCPAAAPPGWLVPASPLTAALLPPTLPPPPPAAAAAAGYFTTASYNRKGSLQFFLDRCLRLLLPLLVYELFIQPAIFAIAQVNARPGRHRPSELGLAGRGEGWCHVSSSAAAVGSSCGAAAPVRLTCLLLLP